LWARERERGKRKRNGGREVKRESDGDKMKGKYEWRDQHRNNLSQ
jgi:hypothetical protein